MYNNEFAAKIRGESMKKAAKYIISVILFTLCPFTACSNSEDMLSSIQLVTVTDSAVVEYTAAEQKETQSETEIPEQFPNEHETAAEDIKYYIHDSNHIFLEENGDFALGDVTSSFHSIALGTGEITSQYKYEDNMLILEYSNGVTMCFEVNEENDTLTFQKELSYYPFELAEEIWGLRIGVEDGSVFERRYYD